MEPLMVFEPRPFAPESPELAVDIAALLAAGPISLADAYNGLRGLGSLPAFQKALQELGLSFERQRVRCWRCKAGSGQASCAECAGSGAIPGGATLIKAGR